MRGFFSANNSTKVLSFQKSGSTASFDPSISFSLGSRRVSWRLDNGSAITQIAGNTIIYTGFTGDSNLRTIEMRGSSFKNINYFDINTENLYGNLNLSPIPNIGGNFNASFNANLTSITHSYSTSNFSSYFVLLCNLIGNHDLTMFPNLGGYFNVGANNNLTGITHTASTKVFTNYIAYNGLAGNLDLSMLSGLGGRIELVNNPNLTGVDLPISTQPIQGFEMSSCNITGTLSLSGFSSLGSISSATTYIFQFHSNPNLNNVLFPIGAGYLRNDANNASNSAMGMFSCNLGYVDFKPLSGCTILSGATVGLPRFELFDNVMTTADVNRVLSDFDLISTLNYSGWTATSGTTGGYINISLNSAPDGSSGGFNGTGATVNLMSKGWTVITD